MATNLALDDNLIMEAKRIGKHKTKREAVTRALEEYIQHHKQLEILDVFGKIEIDADYDHRVHRKR